MSGWIVWFVVILLLLVAEFLLAWLLDRRAK